MSNYRSMIDQALEAARARSHSPVETEKSAAAYRPESSLVKEAQEVASALEFISLSASGNDTVAAFRQEMIRDFYKSATASSPAQGPTSTSGTQGVAPSEGKTRLAPKGLVGGNSPAQGAVSAATKDGEKALLESFKQAEGQSLYDVLMNNKTAAAGGPAEHDSETMAGVGTANENSTYRKTLHTNEGPVNANRRELKKSTRARLAEAFAHTNDTLGDATAAQIFPRAAARGNLKIASSGYSGRETAEAASRARRERFAQAETSKREAEQAAAAMKRALEVDPATLRPGGPATNSEFVERNKATAVADRLGANASEGKPPAAPDKPQLPARLPRRSDGAGSAAASAAKAGGKSVDPTFLSKHKGKLLGGAAAAAALAGGGYYLKNRKNRTSGTSKTASQTMAGLGGLGFGPLGAALGADDERRLPSAVGAGLGGFGGAALGFVPGVLAGSPEAALVGGLLGGTLGQGAGAYLAHGKDMSAKERLLRMNQKAALEQARMKGDI